VIRMAIVALLATGGAVVTLSRPVNDRSAVQGKNLAARIAVALKTRTPEPPAGVSPASSDGPPTVAPTAPVDLGEPILTLPDIGDLFWACRGVRKTGSLVYKFSTTFTASMATETVSYSLDGGPWVSKVLQPGQLLSTRLNTATSHTWRVVQPIEPYTTNANIVVTMGHNTFGQCLNPDIHVSRSREDHTG